MSRPAVHVTEDFLKVKASTYTPKSFAGWLKRYGVDERLPQSMPALFDEGEYIRHYDEGDIVSLSGHALGQAPIGRTIDVVQRGYLRDPGKTYSPAILRGTSGSFGLYEEYLATESQLYDAVFSVTELAKSGVPVIKPGIAATREGQARLDAWTRAQQIALGQLKCVDGGWKRFVHEAMSSVWAGCATFCRQHSWSPQHGWILTGCEPRLQNTIDRWIEDPELDTLVGVQYRSPSGSWMIPRWAPSRAQQLNRLLLVRVNGYGGQWEGLPPTRPAIHWIKFKRLLAAMAPAVAEAYGSPRTYVSYDPAFLQMVADGSVTASVGDVREAYGMLAEALALDVPVLGLPPGIKADMQAPSGAMPDIMAWIQYCDQMISATFSTEGNLLGMQAATGSYAQAEVYERRFLRSAPYYKGILEDAVADQILAPLARQFAGELVQAPRLVIESLASIDASTWLDNARKLFGPNLPLEQWPDTFRKRAYQLMGLDYEVPP